MPVFMHLYRTVPCALNYSTRACPLKLPDVDETSGRRRISRPSPLRPEDSYLYINSGRENLNQYIETFRIVTFL